MNLELLQEKTILQLGKSRAFVQEVFETLMRYKKIKVVHELEESVSHILEGRMLTPYEQNSVEALYEKQEYTFIGIDALEEALAKEIDSDSLLMSLKLSHDTQRLKSFIQNQMISDTLFFKLIKMYKWGGEDFFENDDNRDVSAAFILRFYENIERNHNVQFATTGFIHLVNQAKDSTLLDVISRLEPLSFHPKIRAGIAMSRACDATLQKRLLAKGYEQIQEALSLNPNLDESIVDQFLQDASLGANVAKNIHLNAELFEKCSIYEESLAMNPSLSSEMQKELFSKKKDTLNLALAQNGSLDEQFVVALLALNDAALSMKLFENPATPIALLQEAYKDEQYHMALAKNESTPVEILYQLQLDSRYERHVKTNAGFGKHIQSENIGWLL